MVFGGDYLAVCYTHLNLLLTRVLIPEYILPAGIPTLILGILCLLFVLRKSDRRVVFFSYEQQRREN